MYIFIYLHDIIPSRDACISLLFDRQAVGCCCCTRLLNSFSLIGNEEPTNLSTNGWLVDFSWLALFTSRTIRDDSSYMLNVQVLDPD